MFKFNPPVILEDLQSQNINGKRFYTTPDGIRLPSVTTVIGAKKKQSIMEWRNRVGEETANKISAKASSRGNRVHKLCEDYIANVNEYARGAFPDALEMFRTIKPVIDEHVGEVWYQEQALYSLQLEMAGRVDLIAYWDGVLSIIDFKTSSRIKTKDMIGDYFAQETAYALMVEELIGEPINQLVTLMAVDDEQPLVFIEKTEDHLVNLVEHIQFYKGNV
jgi:genome maintenance exonuclease 1